MQPRDVALVESLIAIANETGNKMLERRMADLTVWYYKNRASLDPTNLAGRQKFMETAFWIMLEVVALQQERIHDLEAKGRSKHLYLPSGVTVNGSRSYG